MLEALDTQQIPNRIFAAANFSRNQRYKEYGAQTSPTLATGLAAIREGRFLLRQGLRSLILENYPDEAIKFADLGKISDDNIFIGAQKQLILIGLAIASSGAAVITAERDFFNSLGKC